MKRILLVALFLAVVIKGWSQQSLFEEAIRRGPTPNGFYCIENPKKKDIKEQDLRNYAKKKGYVVGRVATSEISKFGDLKIVVYKFEFMNPQDFDIYAFNMLKGGASISYSQLKNRGVVYFTPSKMWTSSSSYNKVTIGTPTEPQMGRVDDALWSGKISDGLIDGDGIGFIKLPNNGYVYFSGKFSHGLPIGVSTLKRVVRGENLGQIKAKEIQNIEVPSVERSEIPYLLKANDAKLKQATMYRLGDFYKEEMHKVLDAYKKAQTLNASNYSSFQPDLSIVKMVDTYKSLNYDPDKLLSKAIELQDVYQVVRALNRPVRSRYYGSTLSTLFSGVQTWREDIVVEDRSLVNGALNIAREGRSGSGFKSFYGQILSRLEAKSRELESGISSSRKEYDKMLADKRADNNRNYSGGGWSNGGSSSSKSGVDVEQIKISDFSYEVDDEWYSNAGDDILDRYRKEVRFKDNDGSLKGYIFIDDKKRYSPWIDASSSYSYDSWNNLIVALYAYKKYGRIRKTGRK